MSSVDSRIVNMRFNNGQFNGGVSDTISALDKLKSALSFKNSSKEMENLEAQTSRFNMRPMEVAVAGVSKSFIVLSTLAITTLTNITNKVVNAGIQMGKSLTLDPILQGFGEYELKMNSIQTILANTERHGTTLKEVTKTLDDLNTYADKTIYNFAEMTKNIGLFTNAGIRVEDASDMIQGFSNVAAASGTSAQGAAGAAYQLSQALSAGTIRLMDWRSLTNVGMGNRNMQDGLLAIADAMGTFEGTTITAKQAAEDFNGSLEQEWLSADVMEQYLKIMAGKVTPAQMKALGLTGEQIERFRKQAKTAEEAATKVRTWTQLLGTMQEAVGSGWAQTFDIIIGDFDDATELFTEVSNSFGEIIERSAKARNDLLQGWSDKGGRVALIDGLRAGLQALGAIIGTVKKAFRDIFPAITVDQLVKLSERFRDFMLQLKPGKTTLENLRRTLRGIFAIFKIIWEVVKGVANVFKSFFGAIFANSGEFLDFSGNLGDMLTNFSKTLDMSGAIVKFFGKIGDGVATATQGFKKFLGVLRDVFKALSDFGGKALSGLGDTFTNIFDGFKFDAVTQAVGAGGIATIGLALRKLVKNGLGIEIGGGFLDGIGDALSGLTGVLEAMQANLKANVLLKIAGAIALLTVSIVLLASIDPEALVRSMKAIAVTFAMLLASMKVLSGILASKGLAKAPVVGAALVLIAGAILILSVAIKNLSSLSWEELAKGLAGVAGGLVILAAAVKVLGKSSKRIVRTGIGLIAIAIALNIMARALKTMGSLDISEIAKGLGTMAGALILVTAAARVMPSMLRASVSLVILGVALNIIATAVKKFASIDLKGAGKGLLVMAGSMVIIAGAMRLMPSNLLGTSVALVAISVALNLIAAALRSMSMMSWEEIAKGLVALGGSLLILAGALYLMSKARSGAAALAVAAFSLMLLVPPLIALSQLTWEEIAKGLVALAGALTVIGVAAAIFGASAPLLLIGGAALLLFGIGLTAVGIAALLFAKAFQIAIEAAKTGSEEIERALNAVITYIPKAMKAFGEGLVEFIKAIGSAHTEIVQAFSSILGAMLEAVIQNVPKIFKLFDTMLTGLVKIIYKWFPVFVNLGFSLILKLMDGMRSNIYEITKRGVDIVVRFINGIADNIGRVIRAGANLVIKFINGIADNYPRIVDAGMKALVRFIDGLTRAVKENSGEIRRAGRDLGYALIDGMTGGLLSKASNVTRAAKDVASRAWAAAKERLGISSPSKAFMELGKYSTEGLAVGLLKYQAPVERASTAVGNTAIQTLQDTLKDISSIVESDVDLNPVITPVLDLTSVRRDATALDKLVGRDQLMAGVTYSQANALSAERRATVEQAAPAQTSGNIEFKQYNYSPKALSTIDIYRQTRSQFSLAKEVLSP